MQVFILGKYTASDFLDTVRHNRNSLFLAAGSVSCQLTQNNLKALDVVLRKIALVRIAHLLRQCLTSKLLHRLSLVSLVDRHGLFLCSHGWLGRRLCGNRWLGCRGDRLSYSHSRPGLGCGRSGRRYNRIGDKRRSDRSVGRRCGCLGGRRLRLGCGVCLISRHQFFNILRRQRAKQLHQHLGRKFGRYAGRTWCSSLRRADGLRLFGRGFLCLFLLGGNGCYSGMTQTHRPQQLMTSRLEILICLNALVI